MISNSGIMQSRTFKGVSILSDSLAPKLREFCFRNAALTAGYNNINELGGPHHADFGTLPRAPLKRTRIFTGNADTFAYNVHSQICRFSSRYIVVWNAGLQHETAPGQQINYSVSEDYLHWGSYLPLKETDPDSGIVRYARGLCATDSKLTAYCWNVKDNCFKKSRTNAFVTSDLQTWKKHKDILHSGLKIQTCPKPTAGGRLLCCATDFNTKGIVALLWDMQTPWSEPEVVKIPAPGNGSQYLLEEATWYQTDEGRIVMFWRDELQSLRLYIGFSDDDGKSWTEPVITDFPDSMARSRAGRLTDGRYFLIGNSYSDLLNRRYLMLSLSSDGLVFDKMYILADEPTHRRIEGMHKEDGYHYPHTLVVENQLLVVFAVNKEDIECGVIDTTQI